MPCRIIAILMQVLHIAESSQRVKRITDDILFIGKLDSNQFQLAFSPFSVPDLVYLTGHQHWRAAIKGQIQLLFVITCEVPLIMGDANRISQVLSNLISNGECMRLWLNRVFLCVRSANSSFIPRRQCNSTQVR